MEFYERLATWWPVISPVEEYAEEAAELLALLQRLRPDARTLLELGSGGGHVAYYLAPHYSCCLTDVSAPMLAMSAQLNPSCEHVVADMRTLGLGRQFDVVLAHDAIDYITSVADLARVGETAWAHLRPGGVVVLLPDAVIETFEPGTDVSGSDAPDGRAARLFEWSEAVPPGATSSFVHYAFLLRDANGAVESVYERHETGMFPEATWVHALEACGFSVQVLQERTLEDRPARRIFVGEKLA
jgi:SAM-dependent methyltransferase